MDIIDQYHGDPAFVHLHVLTRHRPAARDLLKTASFDTAKETINELPSSAFAWQDERRFPVHTREDTVASILYRSKLGSSVPEYVDQALVKAATIYGINKNLFTDVKQASETSVEVNYALPEEQRLPLDSVEQIKVAEYVLTRDYTKLSLEKRAEAFARLTKASKAQSVALSPLTQKMAGLTISSTKVLRDWLEARAAVATGPTAASFDKLAQALTEAPEYLTNRDELIKLASTISTLDKKAGLERHYDRKLPDPLQTVFNTTKVAGLTCDVGGTQMDCAELMALPPEIWDQLDVPELAEVAASGDEATFKQVFDTLPMDLKIVLSQQFNG